MLSKDNLVEIHTRAVSILLPIHPFDDVEAAQEMLFAASVAEQIRQDLDDFDAGSKSNITTNHSYKWAFAYYVWRFIAATYEENDVDEENTIGSHFATTMVKANATDNFCLLTDYIDTVLSIREP